MISEDGVSRYICRCIDGSHIPHQPSVCKLNILNSHINSQRHQIPDVPVLYLVEPTAANLQLIASDLSNNLYSDAYINFLYSISRPLMEDFAAQIAASGTSESIAQVFDQYLNFIVGEPDLFSLGMGKETYSALNSAQTKDEDLDNMIERIVIGLYSVVVTMGMSTTYASVPVTDVDVRVYTYNTLSAWRCGRDDRRKIGSQAQRPYSQLKG